MKRWHAWSTALLLGCGAPPPADAPPFPAAATPAAASANPHAVLARSTVMLLVLEEYFDGEHTRSSEGSGSGFVVDFGGERAVATAAHVVGHATEIEMVHGTGFRAPVQRVLAIDEEADVAVLETAELPPEAVAVPLADKRPNLADKVVLISSPLGLDTTIAFGTVAAFRPHLKAFQLAAGVSPGSSGGLVADEAGRVLGVIRAKAPTVLGGENIALITPTSSLKRAIDDPHPRKLAQRPDGARMAVVREHSLVTTGDSPFEGRAAAASFDLQAGDRPLEHYCATASDRGATVALGEADASVGEVAWRVARGRSCASFSGGQAVRVWVGHDRVGVNLRVRLERQK